MSTAAQIQANRANAQSSTGPNTPEGKSRSARNNLRQGLASGRLIIHGESQAEYDALEADLIESHKPANATEKILVLKMAQHHWLSQRAIGLQALTLGDEGPNTKNLAVLIRYQTTNDRAFLQTLAALSKLQKERKKEEIGFVSQPSAQVKRQSPSFQRLPHIAFPNRSPKAAPGSGHHTPGVAQRL